ncbi:hypothetical protein ACF3NG_07650 [Aerococcaceae bacterium WGS1372]
MNRISLIALGERNMKGSLAFYKGLEFRTYEKDLNLAIVFLILMEVS